MGCWKLVVRCCYHHDNLFYIFIATITIFILFYKWCKLCIALELGNTDLSLQFSQWFKMWKTLRYPSISLYSSNAPMFCSFPKHPCSFTEREEKGWIDHIIAHNNTYLGKRRWTKHIIAILGVDMKRLGIMKSRVHLEN